MHLCGRWVMGLALGALAWGAGCSDEGNGAGAAAGSTSLGIRGGGGTGASGAGGAAGSDRTSTGRSGNGAAGGTGAASAEPACRSMSDCTILPGSYTVICALPGEGAPAMGCGTPSCNGAPPVPDLPLACNTDLECKQSTRPFCNAGFCETCRTDEHCVGQPQGSHCANSKCVTCSEDAHCTAAGAPHCVAQSCVECGEASHCPADRPVCSAGACGQCGSNADCAEGACVERTCKPICEDDAFCIARQGGVAQQRCASRRCEPTPCTSTDACMQPFGCVEGFCGRASCTTDADCENAPYCVSGKCAATLGRCLQGLGAP